MKILENVNGAKKDDVAVIIIVSYQEARILNDALEAYAKDNKRKKNAQKMAKQFYENLPY